MLDRNLSLSLIRVTEAAALASAKYLGRGDKNAADQAGVDGMRKAFDTVNVKGTVVIGEGELDEAPMLYIGETIGSGEFEVDIAVDPVDGTGLLAKGLPNAISVIAVAPKGCLLHAPDTYMTKMVVGPKAKGKIDIEAPIEDNIRAVAKALNKDISDMTIIIQDRPRHEELINRIRNLGARIKLFGDGDVATGIATCFEHTGIDMLVGIGGAPEGVITAAAIKCMGGDMQGKLNIRSEEEMQRCRDLNLTDEDINKVYKLDDLVKGDEAFFAATGISDGDLLKGVVYHGNNYAKTHSVTMRGQTGTIRFVEAMHKLDKTDMMKGLMEKHGEGLV